MSIVIFVVLGRLLSPEDFGLVSLGSVLIDVGALLTVSGFHRALVQRERLEPGHLDAAFWSSTVVGCALCVATVASADWIAGLLDEPRFASVLRVLSLSFVIIAVGAVPYAMLHRQMAFKAFAARQLLATVAGGGVGVGLAFSGAGAWALVGQALASAVCSTIVVFASARWRPRLRFSVTHWREIAGFGTLSLGIDLLDVLKNRFDDLLIGVVLGATALGYYGVAFRTYSIALEVVTYSLSAVVFPILSRIVADRERGGRAVVTITKFTVCATVPLFLGLAAIADQALLGLFGPQWGPAVVVLRILCVAAALGAGVTVTRDVVLAAGRPRLELHKTLVYTLLLIVGFAIGVQWDLSGVAHSRAVVAAVMIPIELYVLLRVVPFNVRSYMLTWIRPLPAVAAMLAVILGARAVFDPPISIVWLAALTTAGAATYVMVLWLTAQQTVREGVSRLRTRHV